MKKGIDVLLVNSFAPRQRIATDAALENGLAMIRTYLEDKGFSVYVVDEQRISLVEKGVPKWWLELLRVLVKWQLKSYTNRYAPLLFLAMMLAWPVHSLALYFREKQMDRVIENIVNLVKTDNIPFVGIKVWGGAPYKWSVKLAARVRAESPETTVIAGGPHVKVYGENVLSQGEFDLAIMGPGEKLIEYLLNKRKIAESKKSFLESVQREFGPSPLIRTGNYSEQGDFMSGSSTIPNYRYEDMHDKVLFHTLIDGLGCTWNKCSFCSHTRQNVHYIPRSIEEIKNEITIMIQKGIAFFRFSSSETPLGHGKAIAQMLLNEHIQINYSMFARPGKVSKYVYETYCLMIKSGLRAVFMGGETGHDLINQQIMNKGVVKKEIVDTIQCIKLAAAQVNQPCQVVLSIIYPTPLVAGVTLQDVYDQTIDLIRAASPDAVIVNPPGVFPGTDWFINREKLGFKLGADFVSQLMNYEYSIYKPVEFWPSLDYTLNDLDMRGILRQISILNKAIVEMGIPINISDEYLMMSQAIGCSTPEDLFEFKRRSYVDIISGTSRYIGDVTKQMNMRSRELAASNFISDSEDEVKTAKSN